MQNYLCECDFKTGYNNGTLKTCHQEEKYKQLYIHNDQNVPKDSKNFFWTAFIFWYPTCLALVLKSTRGDHHN
jgi:hypothetical protein